MKCETCIHNPICIRITHTFGCTENCGYYLEKPKQGEWIPKTFSTLKCSKCEFEFNFMRCDFYLNMFFCPNCGASMCKLKESYRIVRDGEKGGDEK